MSDETTAPGTGDPSASRSDTDEISRHLCSIVEKMFHEHMNWLTGYNNWCNQMLMNMQPIPPQAHADMANRQRWLGEFMAQFDPVAEILERNGQGDLAERIAGYQDGLDRITTTRNETLAAMSADDAETQRKIMGIHNQMAADNLRAASDRLNIQKETAAYVQERTAEGIAAQQAANRRMNETVKRGLFGL